MNTGPANHDLEALRAEITGLQAELDAARAEMQAACLGEASARHALADQSAELAELRAHGERTEADRRLLAEIQGSRSYRAITIYRRGLSRLRNRRSR